MDSSLNISNQGYLDERIDFIEVQSSSKLPAKLSFISTSDSKKSVSGKVTSIGSNKYRIKFNQIIPSQALYGGPDDDGPDNPKVHYSIQKGLPVVYSAKLSKNFKILKFKIQPIKQSQNFDYFTLSPLKTKFISPVDSFEIKTRNDLENRFPRKVVSNFTIKNKLTELRKSKEVIEKQENTTWNVRTNFTVNEDEVLVIRKGVQVLIDPDVSIQIKGTLLVDGSKEFPVVFTSSNDLKPWGSLYWQNNHHISKLKHFKVINGNNHRTSLQYYSGVVSAYNSTIILENCEFKQNRGIDVLNVKYSYSLVDRCLVIDNADDAIDYDFSSGKIMNSKFISNGGDGVDLSFATTLIENNFFEKNADKGISVGEKSMPIIKNNQLKSSQIGIAVKDISVARITGNTFIENKKDIFLYNKKPYFGGGLGILSNNKYPSGKAKIKVSSESKAEVIK